MRWNLISLIYFRITAPPLAGEYDETPAPTPRPIVSPPQTRWVGNTSLDDEFFADFPRRRLDQYLGIKFKLRDAAGTSSLFLVFVFRVPISTPFRHVHVGHSFAFGL